MDQATKEYLIQLLNVMGQMEFPPHKDSKGHPIDNPKDSMMMKTVDRRELIHQAHQLLTKERQVERVAEIETKIRERLDAYLATGKKLIMGHFKYGDDCCLIDACVDGTYDPQTSTRELALQAMNIEVSSDDMWRLIEGWDHMIISNKSHEMYILGAKLREHYQPVNPAVQAWLNTQA